MRTGRRYMLTTRPTDRPTGVCSFPYRTAYTFYHRYDPRFRADSERYYCTIGNWRERRIVFHLVNCTRARTLKPFFSIVTLTRRPVIYIYLHKYMCIFVCVKCFVRIRKVGYVVYFAYIVRRKKIKIRKNAKGNNWFRLLDSGHSLFLVLVTRDFTHRYCTHIGVNYYNTLRVKQF